MVCTAVPLVLPTAGSADLGVGLKSYMSLYCCVLPVVHARENIQALPFLTPVCLSCLCLSICLTAVTATVTTLCHTTQTSQAKIPAARGSRVQLAIATATG